MEIIAEDKGSPKLKSTPLVVAVTVLDENDNDPLFTESGYKQNITENLSSGFFVKEVEAIDADIDANGQVTYAILSGDMGYFRIENLTGICLIRFWESSSVVYVFLGFHQRFYNIFSAKSCSFTNFKMSFQAVVEVFVILA